MDASIGKSKKLLGPHDASLQNFNTRQTALRVRPMRGDAATRHDDRLQQRLKRRNQSRRNRPALRDGVRRNAPHQNTTGKSPRIS